MDQRRLYEPMMIGKSRHAAGGRRPARGTMFFATLLGVALGGCGGSPIGNPSTVSNPVSASGQHLAFAYFQRCIFPIFLTQLQINLNGSTATNECAGSGCHNNSTGTGGAFRVIPSAQTVDVTNPANTAAVIQATDMYKNFYSAQGEVIINTPNDSLLLNKPLLRNVLHGGGLVFPSVQDPHAQLIEYWITHPAPQGADEFSTATYSMFTPADPNAGACNTN
ncbi:MAG TPA: hypothetical protein VMU33_15435 [Burkholderiaceae bacterium]|nr:hypothetical protein [Burkholderiaceae bacterium]